MAREIRSQVQLLAANSPIPVSDFKDRLVKLIPSEIVTAYVTLYGLIGDSKVSGKKDILLWIVVGILFLLNPIYLYFISNVKKSGQIIFTTVAFAIWVLAIGSPSPPILDFPATFVGSILLILYTLFIPFIYKG